MEIIASISSQADMATMEQNSHNAGGHKHMRALNDVLSCQSLSALMPEVLATIAAGEGFMILEVGSKMLSVQGVYQRVLESYAGSLVQHVVDQCLRDLPWSDWEKDNDIDKTKFRPHEILRALEIHQPALLLNRNPCDTIRLTASVYLHWHFLRHSEEDFVHQRDMYFVLGMNEFWNTYTNPPAGANFRHELVVPAELDNVWGQLTVVHVRPCGPGLSENYNATYWQKSLIAAQNPTPLTITQFFYMGTIQDVQNMTWRGFMRGATRPTPNFEEGFKESGMARRYANVPRPYQLAVVSNDAFWYYASDPRACSQRLVEEDSRVRLLVTGTIYTSIPGRYELPHQEGHFVIDSDNHVYASTATNGQTYHHPNLHYGRNSLPEEMSGAVEIDLGWLKLFTLRCTLLNFRFTHPQPFSGPEYRSNYTVQGEYLYRAAGVPGKSTGPTDLYRLKWAPKARDQPHLR